MPATAGLKNDWPAETAFTEAHKVKPEEARALVGLAQSFVSRGRVKEAEEQVDAALKISPELVDAQVLKAELRRINRDFDGAIEWFSKAIGQRSNHLLARLGRAESYIDLNRDAEAEPVWKAVLAAGPRHPVSR